MAVPVQVRLVLELCDLGTLQEFLVKGGFKRPTGQYDMAGLIATMQDVARAMHHLHSENIIHGDLKVRPTPWVNQSLDGSGPHQ
jgi:serine/threonine protein kinase